MFRDEFYEERLNKRQGTGKVYIFFKTVLRPILDLHHENFKITFSPKIIGVNRAHQ